MIKRSVKLAGRLKPEEMNTKGRGKPAAAFLSETICDIKSS